MSQSTKEWIAALVIGAVAWCWRNYRPVAYFRSLDMKTEVKLFIGAIGCAIVGGILYYILCLNHVDVTDVGIAYNSLDGTVTVQSHPGWYRTSPFVRVCHLSTLPMRVTIPSSATIINSKIVRFKPEGAVDFVKRQGFSWSLTTEQENIMLGYAYSGKQFPFMEVVEQASSDASAQTALSALDQNTNTNK